MPGVGLTSGEVGESLPEIAEATVGQEVIGVAESRTNAEVIVAVCTAHDLTIAVAESLTGGALISRLIDVPGASSVVRGGIVAYATPIKQSLLRVDSSLLAEHGPVHPLVAQQMAVGVRQCMTVAQYPADIGISTTGIAGPDSADGQPVGRVYLGFALPDQVFDVELQLAGSRGQIREQTVQMALKELTVALEMYLQRSGIKSV